MDVKFINPFLKGTIEVLKKMAFVEPRPGKVYLKKTSIAGGDVSGIIGITGDATGSLAISFHETCICHIVSCMLGELYTKINQDVFDAVGEITNMISGVARTYLEKEGMAVYAAIPSVVYGQQHTINHILNSPSIVIPFSIDQGSFVVDVCIKKTAADVMRAEHYQVLNQKTPVASRIPVVNDVQLDAAGVSFKVDKKAVMKTKLKEIVDIRDDMVRQLTDKPFMEISKRQMLKKRIPYLDAQIRHLKLDISALDMIAKISRDDFENPKLVKHYQHYEDKKPKA